MTVGYTNASWTLKADLIATYVCRVLTYLDERGYQAVTPIPPEPGERTPLIGLMAGYVMRSAAHLPKQGARPPWRLYQNYPRDVLLLRYGKLDDRGVRFSRAPAPVSAP
jgi:hypothetical protein